MAFERPIDGQVRPLSRNAVEVERDRAAVAHLLKILAVSVFVPHVQAFLERNWSEAIRLSFCDPAAFLEDVRAATDHHATVDEPPDEGHADGEERASMRDWIAELFSPRRAPPQSPAMVDAEAERLQTALVYRWIELLTEVFDRSSPTTLHLSPETLMPVSPEHAKLVAEADETLIDDCAVDADSLTTVRRAMADAILPHLGGGRAIELPASLRLTRSTKTLIVARAAQR